MDLKALEVTTGHYPQAAVIWLHGLGADGYDFAPLVGQLGLPDRLSARFIFPHAPIRPVTLNGGTKMPTWFDIYGLEADAREDEAGIKAMAVSLERLINRELSRDIAPDRLFLGGFSQGGALALYLGLRLPQALAGIIGLSTYLPLLNRLALERTEASLHTPILMAHGTLDSVVPFSFGERSKDRLKALGYSVEWYTYPLPHTVNVQEIHDLRDWMVDRLEQ